MTSNDPGIGFGLRVTGGGTAAPTSVTTLGELRDELDGLSGGSTAKVIVLDGTAGYDLSGANFQISASNVTIRAGTQAVLNNIRLAIDLDHATNILIQDLIFRNDGSDHGARDAITIVASDPPRNAQPSDVKQEIRITHCSFNGYFDIAIDTKGAVGRPRLFMTIDHCLFFDATPGQKGARNSDFFNRGAINISARSSHNSDSRVTIANNVFVKVWRRCPRVAGGNFVHVFNNLLYRPGFANPSSNNTTWRGIEVGGGDRDPDGSQALVEANRFIPAPNKLEVITTNRTTQTDITSTVNEFDDSDGRPATPNDRPGVPATLSNTAVLSASGFYSNKRPPPPVTAASAVVWSSVVANAGSFVTTDTPSADARQLVQDVLTAAATTRTDP